jgi:hypothetical protein
MEAVMKMTMLVMLALAAVLVPAALAATPAQAPSTFCKNNAALIGPTATYKTVGACVAKQAALAKANRVNAATACKAEMADTTFASTHDNKTFDQFYGANADNGKGKGNGNAYGNCVSQKASGKTAQQQNAQVNAAKKCKTTLKDQIGASPKTYRTFGACVSAQTKLS